MAEPKGLSVRRAAVAGMFYPGDALQCRALAQSYLDAAPAVEEKATSGRWLGGVVPHAGWVCSGAIAAQTMVALAKQPTDAREVDVIVVFGAVHTPLAISRAALDSHQKWAVPGGDSLVAAELEARLAELKEWFGVDDRFHAREHAVEVELPLIQLVWPRAVILPVEVPPIDSAAQIGQRVAQQVAAAKLSALYLASSDLTHYGANYGFAPAGLGEAALEWANENDRRLLRLITDMAIEQVVPEVKTHYNACGAGAIAAMMAACKEAGATAGKLLRHANSFQTLSQVAPQPPHSAVGYAALIVG